MHICRENFVTNFHCMVICLLFFNPCPRAFYPTIIFPNIPSRLPDFHDDVIKWKHFPRNWPFVQGIHRSPVNSPRKGQWRGALMFSLICVWISDWVNNREAGDLRRYLAHYDVIVMINQLFKIGLFINHPRTSTISYAGNEKNKHRSTILSIMLLEYSISRWLFFTGKCQDQ